MCYNKNKNNFILGDEIMDSISAMWAHLISTVFFIIAVICFIFVFISIYKKYKKNKMLSNKDRAGLSICIGSLIATIGTTIFHRNNTGETLSILLGAVFFLIIPIIMLFNSAYRTDKKKS